MSVLQHKVVSALPVPLQPNSIYYVRSGTGFDQYVTNSSGVIVAYPANSSASDINSILHPNMTGSITLNGTLNNTVVMTDIVTELGLEIGDVIRIDTGAYNKLHTVESITDNSSIIVNYEHAGNRGNGSLKLPNFTGQATVTRIAKWFNAPLGVGQAPVVLAAQRVANTAYKNTTGRPIQINQVAIGSGAQVGISPDGSSWIASTYGSTTDGQNTAIILPNGWYWRKNFTNAMYSAVEVR